MRTGYRPESAWCSDRNDEYLLRVVCVWHKQPPAKSLARDTHAEPDDIGDIARRSSFCGLESVDYADLLAQRDLLIPLAAIAHFRRRSRKLRAALLGLLARVGEACAVRGGRRSGRGGDEGRSLAAWEGG